MLPPRFENEMDRELLVLVVDDGGGGGELLSYHCFAGVAVMLFLDTVAAVGHGNGNDVWRWR